MSRRDAVVLGSRLLAVLLTVWALTEASRIPSSLYSFIRYADPEPIPSAARLYWRQYYLISLGFLITRLVGYSLIARWLYRCGPDIEELLLPVHLRENANY